MAEPEPLRRVEIPRAWLGVLATAALTLMVVASLDARENLTTVKVDGGRYDLPNPMLSYLSASRDAYERQHPPQRYESPSWVEYAFLAFCIAFGIVVLWLAVRWFLDHRPKPPPRSPDQAPDADGIDLSTLVKGNRAAQHAAMLREGSPRNAIVATWLELERLVAEAGVGRRPSETSSELAIRVMSGALGDHPAAQAAVTDLNGLFREARFSAHEIGEEQRERATHDLAAIHAGLRARHDGAPATRDPGGGR